jgi:hypothetical protein
MCCVLVHVWTLITLKGLKNAPTDSKQATHQKLDQKCVCGAAAAKKNNQSRDQL